MPFQKSAEIFITSLVKWIKLPDLNQRRHNHASCVICKSGRYFCYLFGGVIALENQAINPTIEQIQFDLPCPSTQKWAEVKLDTSIYQADCWQSALILPYGSFKKIMVFGGVFNKATMLFNPDNLEEIEVLPKSATGCNFVAGAESVFTYQNNSVFQCDGDGTVIVWRNESQKWTTLQFQELQESDEEVPRPL